MSTDYKTLIKIKSGGLTRFYGGDLKGCCLSIHQHVSYNLQHCCKYTYNEVLELKQALIAFLQNNKGCSNACYDLSGEGFIFTYEQVKTLVTDLHLYLNDEIFLK